MQDLPDRLTSFLTSLVNRDPDLSPPSRAFVLGGKRLRARLLFAAGEATADRAAEELTLAAAAIELVHAASLVHDDIIDCCDERRGSPSMHRSLGIAAANRSATHLVHRALQLLADLPEWARLRFAETGRTLAQGQLLELLHAGDAALSPETRLEIMASKTASVFGLACELGSRLSGKDASAVSAYRRFGEAFGMSFQIADDVDDLFASEREQGRQPATDLRCAVMSLPIIFALETAAKPRGARLLEPLFGNEPMRLGWSRAFVRASGALERTFDVAARYGEDACQALTIAAPASGNPWLERLNHVTLERIARFVDSAVPETPVVSGT